MLGLGHNQIFSLLQLIHGQYQWIIQILIVIVVSYAFFIFINKLYNKFEPLTKKSQKIWDHAIVEAAYSPAKFLIMLLSSFLILEIINFEVFKVPFFEKLSLLFQALVVIILMKFFLKLGKKIEIDYSNQVVKNSSVDRTTIRAIFNLYQVVVIILSILSLLQVFGIPLSGVIAFGGVGGIAVGFAAKDLLANFFGSIMIFLDRPFAIGDWIRLPERDIEGHVEHIGWRQVVLRNFEQRPMYVPNSLFSTIVIENPSRMLNRRIKQTFGLRYSDLKSLPSIVESIENYLKSNPEIDNTKHILVALINPGSYSLDVLIEAFTKATSKVHYHKVQHSVFVQILSIIESFGAQCPYPTQTIFLENTETALDHAKKKLQ